MTNEQVKNLKVGMYLCSLVCNRNSQPRDEMLVGHPMKVTKITQSGIRHRGGENEGKQYVVFYREVKLVGDYEMYGVCFGGDDYYIVSNALQIRAWREGMTYKEFVKAGQ